MDKKQEHPDEDGPSFDHQDGEAHAEAAAGSGRAGDPTGRSEVRHVFDSDSATSYESAVVVKRSVDAQGVVVDRGGPDARRAATELSSGDNTVRDEAFGGKPDKDASELRAVSMLVQRLNQSGEDWPPPEPLGTAPERGFDCVSERRDGEKLQIQVTTADHELWGELAQSKGTLERTLDVDEAADRIAAAVAAKADKRYAGASDLVLAVDATDAPTFVLDDVVASVRRRHGEAIRAAGFRAVWVVGPTVDLTHRLDAP